MRLMVLVLVFGMICMAGSQFPTLHQRLLIVIPAGIAMFVGIIAWARD